MQGEGSADREREVQRGEMEERRRKRPRDSRRWVGLVAGERAEGPQGGHS